MAAGHGQRRVVPIAGAAFLLLLPLLAGVGSGAARTAPPASSPLSVNLSFADAGGNWNCERGSETIDLASHATGGVAPYTYAWSFGDGTPMSVAADPVHTYAGPGPFRVNLTVQDAAGGAANSSMLVSWTIPLRCTAPASTSWMGYVLYGGLLAGVLVAVLLAIRWRQRLR